MDLFPSTAQTVNPIDQWMTHSHTTFSRSIILGA